MSSFSSISVVIPSLNPTGRLESVVDGLVKTGFDDIIVVNDGSDPGHQTPFDNIEHIKECTVLTHGANMGKGAALKTAFVYYSKERTGRIGVITMDADGQHLAGDAAKCAGALARHADINGTVTGPGNFVVIGTRDFKQPGVPKRNSLGNRLTASALRLLFGLKLSDTQTGLRGIPSRFIPALLLVQGNRFEYETNMLLEFLRMNVPFLEVPIETIYEEDAGERSNFRPFRDSIRIFSRILKYAMSSVTCFLADIGIFTLSMLLLGRHLGAWSILCCTAIARAVSSFMNFNINRLLVFRQKNIYGSRIMRYYALVISLMLMSAGGLWLLSLPFGGERPAGLLAMLKVPLDLTLFFLGYYIQRTWVFKH